MLLSFALIFLVGLALGALFKRLRLPALLGMLIAGIALGPSALNAIDGSVLAISAELRQIALIIILTRAGLALDLGELKRVGRPALLMCFVPAVFEIAGTLLLAPPLLGLSLPSAAILGSVIAAVSPAVVVPRMLNLMEQGYGTEKGIPQLVMAGASVDDIFVIVLFTIFIGIEQGQHTSPLKLALLPPSILLSVAVGVGVGALLACGFKKMAVRPIVQVLILLSAAFLLVTLDGVFTAYLSLSGLLAVMAVGVAMRRKNSGLAARLSEQFSALWVAAEVLLFVLVGASVDVNYAVNAGANAVLLLFLALIFRLVGVFVSLLKTALTFKERLFCMIAYLPKATVQAAIGGIPLALGLNSGAMVLTVSVLSILITAPLGSIGIDMAAPRLLQKEERGKTPPDERQNSAAHLSPSAEK